MPLAKLKEYLEQSGAPYEIVTHAPAFTAQRTADSAHIKGKELAKTVMVRIDDELAMAVLPASYKVNLELLRDTLGAQDVTLASESDQTAIRFPLMRDVSPSRQQMSIC